VRRIIDLLLSIRNSSSTGFYGFLHCWLNAFAEMLRFADRMFYKVGKNSIKNFSKIISRFRIGGIQHHLQRIIEHGMS